MRKMLKVLTAFILVGTVCTNVCASDLGSLYEEKAIKYLIDNGFKIIKQNYHCKIGEIDIIAIKDNILRFIEVKYRKNDLYGTPIQAVNLAKQKKIYSAAQWFLAEHNISDNMCCSFDVIAIEGNNIEYIFNGYGAM